MSCKELNELLGVSITPLTDDGAVSWLSTPFDMPNGSKAPFYVERLGTHVRFFDDGCLYMYFCNLGLDDSSTKNFKFLKEAAKNGGGKFNEDGVVEVIGKLSDAPITFQAYLSIIQNLSNWEIQHRNISHAAEIFVEEVALHLKAWKGTAAITGNKVLRGITGTEHHFPLALWDKPVLAIQANKQQASSALHRLVDVTTDPENAGIRPLVVIDDRQNPKKASTEAKILSAVSTVLPMSRLISNASSAVLH